MSAYFHGFFNNFIDIVYKKSIIFTIYFVVQDWEAKMLKVSPDLVEATRFRRGFY